MVRSVASSGKFYGLPPDKENTGYTIMLGKVQNDG